MQKLHNLNVAVSFRRSGVAL